MGISTFIKSITKQTAVYWGNPISDGMGGYTYDSPIEIKVRWDEKVRIITDPAGREITTVASVMLSEDLDIEGYLYLGTLNDLESAPIPSRVLEARIIMARDKISMIKSTTEFVRTVYLGKNNG